MGCPGRQRLQHRIQCRHDRHRNAGSRRAPHHGAVQRLHLDALALRQIDQQRRSHRSRKSADIVLRSARPHRRRPARPRRGPHVRSRDSRRETVRGSNGSAQSGPIGSRDAPVKPASDDEKDELLPDRHAAILDRFGLDVGRQQARRWIARTRAACAAATPKTSPNTMRRCVPVCSMTPGDAQRGRDVGGAAEDRRLADRDASDLLRAVDAVLQRKN